MSRPLFAQGAFYTAGVQLSNASVVLPFVCAQRGFGWVAGLLFPVFSIGSIVGNTTAPVILHRARHSKHLVVAAAALIMSLLVASEAVEALTNHAVLLLLTSAGIGVTAGISTVAFSDVVCTKLSDARRGRLLLTQGAAGSVLATATTLVVAPMLFPGGSPAGHVHVLWLGAGVLAIAAVTALFLKPAQCSPKATAPHGSSLQTYRKGLRIARTQPWFRRYAITHLTYVPILFGTTFHTLRAADGDVTLHVLVVTSSIGLVAGSVVWQSVSRRFGVRGMLLGSAALSAFAALASTVAETLRLTANVWLQTAIILMAAMAAQAVFTAAISWIGAFAEEEHRATLIGFAAAMVAVTSAAVGALLGLLAQVPSQGWPVLVVLILNVAAGCMALRAPGPITPADTESDPAQAREDDAVNVIDGYIDLFACREALHPNGPRLDVAVAGNQGYRCA